MPHDTLGTMHESSDNAAESTYRPPWLVRELIGTAVTGGICAGGGLVYHLYKGKSLQDGMVGGGILGVFAAIGIGNHIYDAIFTAKPRFTERMSGAQQPEHGMKQRG